MKTLKKMWKQKELYLIVLPVLLYYLLFHYKPMYGLIIAFMDYSPRRGISGSTWVGLQHFMNFFQSIYFKRLLGNTLKISLATIVFGFPAPIILALLMNELRSKKFARVTQTITYMPHFISTVVICSMIREFVKPEGFITQILVKFFDYGGKNLLSQPENFLPIYVISDIWRRLGLYRLFSGVNRSRHRIVRSSADRRSRQMEADVAYHAAGDYANDHHYADYAAGTGDECRL